MQDFGRGGNAVVASWIGPGGTKGANIGLIAVTYGMPNFHAISL